MTADDGARLAAGSDAEARGRRDADLARGSVAIEIAGGAEAPRRARRWMLGCLARERAGPAREDLEIIVSELVTNSVVHAETDAAQLVRITVAKLEDRWRVAVTDEGSGSVPHLRDPDDGAPGGVGLRIIDRLCLGWGVTRTGAGTTEVWCEVPFSR